MQISVADAMREMLETFRLPGEAQQIARITETFAEVYFAASPGTCAKRGLGVGLSLMIAFSGSEVARRCLRPRVFDHHAEYRPA